MVVVDEKPVIIVAPPYDERTHRLGEGYTDTDNGDHIERLKDIIPLTEEEIYGRRLSACLTARSDAYPPVQRQLDALFWGLAALAQGAELPPQTLDWLGEIAAIKAAHPKPAPPEPAAE